MDRVKYHNRNSTKKNYNESFINTFVSSSIAKGLFLVLSFFLIYNIMHSIKITAQKLEILDQAEREVNELRVKNLELNLKLNEIKKTSYLEVEARDRLNFSGKNEIIFVIPDNLLESSKESLDLILEDSVDEIGETTFDIWKEWLS